MIAFLPPGTGPVDLAGVDGMAIGLLSAGIGQVPAEQTFVDIGQGGRVNSSLYDTPLPALHVDPGAGGAPPHVPPGVWRQIRDRAEAVPADLVPGLLGTTLTGAGVAARAAPPLGPAAAILADERGAIGAGPRCREPACPRVTVLGTTFGGLRKLAARMHGRDLLIAVERPPPAKDRQLAIGIAGAGFGGTLTSDSTRMSGFVLSTDIAPTILARLGIPVPDQMNGEPIRGEGAADAADVVDLGARLGEVGPRRAPVIGVNLLIWAAVAALVAVAFRARGLRFVLPLFAVTVAYLPAVLLLTAALEPSELAERLIVGLGAPALAAATLRLVPGYGALAVAGAVSVGGYAVDVIAGSHLTELSLIGPNPAAGIRFYGIGNELEATVAALVPIATGAGLAAWAPRVSARRAATAFVLTAAIAVAAFAPGAFGADVGAAIDLPIGAAVAVGVCLGGGSRRVLLVVAAPLVAVGALVAVDLLLGGDAHLTRSVLKAGGASHLGDVVERRLRLSAASFRHWAGTPLLWLAVLGIGAGIAQRRRIASWFAARPAAWAGFLGAAGATAAGTLANDSGAQLLILGTLVVAVTAGLAWAQR